MRVAVFVVEAEAGVGDGLARGRDGELGEAGHSPRFLVVDVVRGVEAGHFGVDLHRVAAAVELRDRHDAGAPFDAALPEILHRQAQRRYGAHARYHDATSCSSFMLSFLTAYEHPASNRLLRFYRPARRRFNHR